MVRIIAYACLGISAALAAVYGYTTGNTEAMGLLRALGWAAVAFVGGCCPAWVFSHVEDKSYWRALFTGIVALVCAGVTLNGSIGGITGTGDKYAAERAKALDATKSDRARWQRSRANATRWRSRLPPPRWWTPPAAPSLQPSATASQSVATTMSDAAPAAATVKSRSRQSEMR